MLNDTNVTILSISDTDFRRIFAFPAAERCFVVIRRNMDNEDEVCVCHSPRSSGSLAGHVIVGFYPHGENLQLIMAQL